MPKTGHRKIDPNVAWTLYYQLGPSRSLEQLRAALAVGGVSIALSTLKVWSAEYGWVDRVAAADEQAEARATEDAVAAVVEMNRRQIELGRALQNAARTGAAALTADDITARDTARLADVGVKIERLASGEATERGEMLVAVWNVVIRDIAGLFVEVNALPDPDSRRERFAVGLDRIVERQITSADLAAENEGGR